MPTNPIRAFVVEAVSDDGERELTAQIEIDCAACGPIVLLIPGHHLRTVRDVVIDILDQFEYLKEGRTVRTTMSKFTVDGEQAKKARDN